MEPLMKHQREGVKHVTEDAAPHAFLAHEPGLGKTRTTIASLDKLGIENGILVLCPAIGVDQWIRQFLLWQQIPRSLAAYPSAYDPDVIVMSDTRLSRLTKSQRRKLVHKRSVITLDEAHRYKNIESRRSLYVYGNHALMPAASLAANAGRVWLLSGTPAPNHVGELYTHLRALYPAALHNMVGEPARRHEFEDAFCRIKDDGFGRQIVGSRNVPQLRKRMNGFFWPKREKDCIDLPELRIDTFHLPRDRVDAAKMAVVDEALKRAAHDPDPVSAIASIAQHTATERRLLGILKAPLIAELVETELVNHPKVVVFTQHRQVTDYLAKALARFNPLVIDGRTSDKRRHDRIHQFQHIPQHRVMLAQMTTAGEVIELTAARRVILAEPSWVPKDNYQAIKRTHRIGQDKMVHASFAVIANSHDAKIMKAVARKTRELSPLTA